jgi:hypothetical protein
MPAARENRRWGQKRSANDVGREIDISTPCYGDGARWLAATVDDRNVVPRLIHQLLRLLQGTSRTFDSSVRQSDGLS